MNSERGELRREIVAVFGMTLAFIILVTLLFLPFGFVTEAGAFAAAFAGLWVLTIVSTLVLSGWERVFGVTMDTHYSTYVAANLGASVTLVAGWVIYIVVMLWKNPIPFPGGQAIMFATGLVGSYWAFVVVTTFYRGGIYKVVALSVALGGYAIASAVTFVLENWR